MNILYRTELDHIILAVDHAVIGNNNNNNVNLVNINANFYINYSNNII